MNIKKLIFPFFLFFACNAFADNAATVAFDSSTNVVSINVNGANVGRCALSEKLAHVAPRFNWNKRIIILTAVDFISVRDIKNCDRGSVEPSHIPKKVGFLVDVNPKYNIYLALDFVGVSPMAFTATVSRLGERRSVLNLPGIFSQEKGDKKVMEESFGYLESTPGRISPDGRYVSADGTMDCGPNAYPGVWDLLLRKKVTRDDGCATLFDADR